MRTDYKRDLISAVCFLAFGLFIFAMSQTIEFKGMNGDIGSSFFPKMMSGIMCFLSVVLLAKTLFKIKNSNSANTVVKEMTLTAAEKSESAGFSGNKAVFASFVNLIVFVILFRPVGFILSGILFMVIQMAIMTEDSKVTKKKFLIWLVIAVCVGLFVYISFYKIFSMPLPLGLLDYIAEI